MFVLSSSSDILLLIATLSVIVSICTLVGAVYRVNYYKSKLKTQRLKYINLYLNKKFIDIALDIITKNNNEGNICVHMINKIKEYFQLDEVMIWGDEKSSLAIKINNPVIQKEVYDFIAFNINEIEEKLKFQSCVIYKWIINKVDTTIYITSVRVDVRPHLLVCICNSTFCLETSELEMFQGTVQNIIRSAILISNITSDPPKFASI